jgi:hypothetical protein
MTNARCWRGWLRRNDRSVVVRCGSFTARAGVLGTADVFRPHERGIAIASELVTAGGSHAPHFYDR